MMRRQTASMLGMGTRHRQDLEAERQHHSDDRSIEAKLADRPLDGNFPDRRRADDNLVGLVAQSLPAADAQDPAGLLDPPTS